MKLEVNLTKSEVEQIVADHVAGELHKRGVPATPENTRIFANHDSNQRGEIEFVGYKFEVEV